MKNCKVIATCFIGRKRVILNTCVVGYPPLMAIHSQNFPSEESILELLKLNVEQERLVDPGVPCDTVIVNSDTGWQKGNEYLDSINNTSTRTGIFRVVHRPNIGISYGAYNDAYQKYKDEYAYWIFTEDDILINSNNYFKAAIDYYNQKKDTGFVAFIGLSMEGCGGETGEHLKHAHNAAGITHVDILNEVNRKHGNLPYADNSDSQTYPDVILYGEVAFTNEIMKLGYELRTMESDCPLYWFAYDFMRGIRIDAKPSLFNLIKWRVMRINGHLQRKILNVLKKFRK